MKFTKRLVAVAVAIFIFVGSSFDAFAAEQPSSYSTSKNSGERDVVCTTLDGTRANAYYTGSYTYDNLSELSSSALLSSLRSLLTSTHTKNTSYNDCRDYADETDCENGDGRIVTIYTSYSTSQSQYNGGDGWNREHVWPKSLGGYDTSGPGADLHHIRPSENKTNSNRGNLKYGEVTGGKTTVGNLSGESGGTYSGSYFEPLDNAKGDVARICLYMYVRYGGDSRYTCSSITTVFQSVEVLLEWCELDPVDTWEMGRNEVVASIQGNRNVFIDYPEYAWLLFGYEVPDDMVTPSGEAMRSSTSGDNTDIGDGNTNTGNGGNTNTGNGGNTNTGNGGNTDTGNGGNTNTGNGGNTDTGNGGGTNTGDNGNTGTVKCTHTRTETVGALPGCVEQGYSGDTVCADCGKVLVYGTEFPPMGHSYGEDEVVIEPTETDKGIVRRVCSVCGNEELDILPRLAKEGLQVIDIVIIGFAAAVVVADIVAVVVWLFKRK